MHYLHGSNSSQPNARQWTLLPQVCMWQVLKPRTWEDVWCFENTTQTSVMESKTTVVSILIFLDWWTTSKSRDHMRSQNSLMNYVGTQLLAGSMPEVFTGASSALKDWRRQRTTTQIATFAKNSGNTNQHQQTTHWIKQTVGRCIESVEREKIHAVAGGKKMENPRGTPAYWHVCNNCGEKHCK